MSPGMVCTSTAPIKTVLLFFVNCQVCQLPRQPTETGSHTGPREHRGRGAGAVRPAVHARLPPGGPGQSRYEAGTPHRPRSSRSVHTSPPAWVLRLSYCSSHSGPWANMAGGRANVQSVLTKAVQVQSFRCREEIRFFGQALGARPGEDATLKSFALLFYPFVVYVNSLL